MRPLSPATSAKLFVTGSTVGPLVDSFHNQCLLQYYILPISLPWPTEYLAQWSDYPYIFCSSWIIPPLLGIAYVVLGGVLPRLFESGLQFMRLLPSSSALQDKVNTHSISISTLKQKAWIAVASTALIIKLSEYLETHPDNTNGIQDSLPFFHGQLDAHLLVMLGAALSQWALLDGTLAALLAASITSIGGPLAELPFVANGVWEYLPTAGDYLPLAHVPPSLGSLLTPVLGVDYQNLALSSITGPCYFAVTMDAIALGRWFDAESEETENGKVSSSL